jgi:hypothetical protein
MPDRPAFSQGFRTFLRAFAKTTSEKGPHMPLTETRLRALKPKDKPYKVADDRGLYIKVSPAGGKLWLFRNRIGPVEKKLSIGAYPEISLKHARQTSLLTQPRSADRQRYRIDCSGWCVSDALSAPVCFLCNEISGMKSKHSPNHRGLKPKSRPYINYINSLTFVDGH